MPRTERFAPGGMVFHTLNRGAGRMKNFRSERDDFAFEATVLKAFQLYPMRTLAYCWLPNHRHFILWPEEGDQLSALLQPLTNTHRQHWRAQPKMGQPPAARPQGLGTTIARGAVTRTAELGGAGESTA